MIRSITAVTGCLRQGLSSATTVALMTGLGGCAASFSYPDVYHTHLDRYTRVELNGNYHKGQVIHLKQLHGASGIPEMPQIVKMEVGRYQYEIFRELLVLHPKHIFTEGFAVTRTYPFPGPFLDERTTTLEDGTTGMLRNLKPPNDSNLSLFWQFTADRYYAQGIGGVTLHRVMTKQEGGYVNHIVDRYVQHVHEANEGMELSSDFQEQREDWAVREILAFMSHHPGERVVLVYGAAHSFKNNFINTGIMESQLPQLVSMCWILPDDWNLAAIQSDNCPSE